MQYLPDDMRVYFENQIKEFNGVLVGGMINNDYVGDQLWFEAQNGGKDD